MRFVVLGGVYVEDDGGESVAPRSIRQRQLLATLLCQRGRSVMPATLVDWLWDGEPPSSAPKNLQTYVHRLRQRVGADRIVFTAEGYALRIDDGEFDATVFESLARSGSAALAGEDASAAYASLTKALAVWNGEPFADLVGGGLECPEPVRLEGARLAELHVQAQEDCAEAALAIGHAGSLVPGLNALLAEYPFRERLRGALMLALYRAGRTVDALDVYRIGRAVMVDELGIEPGPTLRELEHAILTDDPALMAGASSMTVTDPRIGYGTADSEEQPPPAELPSGAVGFTGRAAELPRLMELLRSGRDIDATGCVATISGPGGVGKSTLAIQAATAVADEFPDGQLYVNLRGATPGVDPLTSGEALARFLRGLGLPDTEVPVDVDEAAARFRSLTTGRRILVVLDDAVGASQVRPLLPGAAGCAALITSRQALTSLTGGVEHLHLGTLSQAEAITLLGQLAGADRIAADPEGAARVAQLCDLLPLALRIAGARLASRSDWEPGDLADRLADRRHRLEELAHDDQAVASSCQISHDALPDQAARLFELIGLLDLPHISVAVAAALVDRPEADVRRDLDSLVAAHFLYANGDHHTLHDLIRLYARQHAHSRPPAEQTAALRRVGHHFLASARNAARQLPHAWDERRLNVGPPTTTAMGHSFDTAADALTWLGAEADNLLAIAEHALALPDDAPMIAAGIAIATGRAFNGLAQTTRTLALGQLGLHAVERHGSASEQSLIGRTVAWSLLQLHRDAEAVGYAERALANAERASDDHEAGAVLTVLGVGLHNHGRPAEAVTYFERAIETSRRAGESSGEATARANCAGALYDLGRIDDTVEMLTTALTIYQADNNIHGAAVAIGNLGQIHLRPGGEPHRAIPFIEQAVRLHREAGNRHDEASSLWLLAHATDAVDQSGARAYREQALQHYVEMGSITTDEADGILGSDVPTLPSHLIAF